MNPTLNDYEAAFDAEAPPPDPERTWRRVERAIRKQQRAPTWDVVMAVLLLGLCVAAGLRGVGPGWGFAGFVLLVVLPRARRKRRKWGEEFAAVESEADLRELCKRQALERAAKHASKAFLRAGLAVSFLAVGAVAGMLGKSSWPGFAAGGIVLLMAAFDFFVRMPLAAREGAILDVEG